jgi:hypothetical protein
MSETSAKEKKSKAKKLKSKIERIEPISSSFLKPKNPVDCFFQGARAMVTRMKVR